MIRSSFFGRAFALATVILALSAAAALAVINTDLLEWTAAPSGSNHYDAAFTSTSNGWVVGADGAWRTQDGGESWSVVTTSTGFTGVSFPDAQHGWMTGYSSSILHTADGGDSWQQQTPSIPSAALGPVRSVDAQHAWVPVPGSSLAAVMYTEDAGSSWHTSVVTTATASMRCVGFADTLNGWVGGTNGFLARTTDGGHTWTQQASGVSGTIQAISAINSTTAWLAVDAGKLLHTSDGGATWEAFNHPDGMTFYGVNFLSATEGWATSWSRVYHTSDGGETWDTISEADNRTVYGAAFPPGVRNVGYFPCYAGVLKLTLPQFPVAVDAPSNGTIAPGSTQVYQWGDSPTFAITPATGYHMTELLIDGTPQAPASTYAFRAVEASHTIGATFALNVYNVVALAGAHGSVTPTGSQSCEHGSASPVYTFAPHAGYHVSNVTLNGISVGARSSYQIPAVTRDSTIIASFMVNKAKVTVSRTPASYSKKYKRKRGSVTFKLSAKLNGAAYHTAKSTITLQSSKNGRTWKTVANLKTNSAGNVSRSIKAKKRGTTYYRWKIGNTSRHFAATSTKFKAVVK